MILITVPWAVSRFRMTRLWSLRQGGLLMLLGGCIGLIYTPWSSSTP